MGSMPGYSKCVKQLRRSVSGDVVEMGDTLVLETSAFAHESSTLSIPTRVLMETWPSGLRRRIANAERLQWRHPFESDRLRQYCIEPLRAARWRRCPFDELVLRVGRMSGTVSHLVGGEARVARRVQVQVLLLPPWIEVEVALGIWKAHPVRSGTCLWDLRVRLALLPPKVD
jgi:hypothetical protein